MKRTIKFLIYAFLLLCYQEILAQSTKPLFQSDSLLKFNIQFHTDDVINDTKERKNHEGEISYTLPDGSVSTHFVKAKVRGNNRAKKSTCKFPPLKLNFKKNKNIGSVFEGQNKLKLVTHCKNNKNFKDYILTEYLIYNLYELVSDYSFQTRLCEITYEDIDDPENTLTHFGFLIEDIDDVAKRSGMIEFKDSVAHQDAASRIDLDKLTLFQFMIGNLDWSIPNRHNMKTIKNPNGGFPIAVPYDFDYSGLVFTSYAAPPEGIDISSVRTRVFRGLCRFNNGYDETIELYQQLKPEFYALIENATYLSEKSRASSKKYIDGFYKVLDNQNQTNIQIRRACRAKHKHFYEYE